MLGKEQVWSWSKMSWKRKWLGLISSTGIFCLFFLSVSWLSLHVNAVVHLQNIFSRSWICAGLVISCCSLCTSVQDLFAPKSCPLSKVAVIVVPCFPLHHIHCSGKREEGGWYSCAEKCQIWIMTKVLISFFNYRPNLNTYVCKLSHKNGTAV